MVKLKVYRTPIGFHDAYVAAPSQKAALAAWGSDANLFARGVAEQVDDPDLIAEPLAHPGEIIKKLRGTPEEQLAALAPVTAQPKRSATPKPRPSRAALEAAEEALAGLEAHQREELQRLTDREKGLARERRDLERRHEAAFEKLASARDRERAKYDRALRASG